MSGQTTPGGMSGRSTARDLGELYRLFSARLLRIVRGSVRAPEAVIEDACQFAWSRLIHERDRVAPDRAAGWLVTTALHEALKSIRRAGYEPSLETMVESGIEFVSPRADRSPEPLAERRERLLTLRSLSERQQRLLWLYGLGLTYEEIARRQGCTSRTVERQIARARTVLREREERAETVRRWNSSARLARAPAPARAAATGAASSR
jgi:RNA polymerase sigma factor (sigma-70 family)